LSYTAQENSEECLQNIRAKFLRKGWVGCKRSMKCNVESRYRLRICWDIQTQTYSF